MESTIKGFIKDIDGHKLLPITRAELVLDQAGNIAMTSPLFEAGRLGTYGLISSEDLAKLKGNNNGQSISDIYDKLGYINQGLKVGETYLNFYKQDNDNKWIGQDINITTLTDQLSIGVAENTITLGLAKINEKQDQDIEYGSDSTNNEIIKYVKVDKYGRLIDVKAGTLNTNEIPDLSGKTFTNCFATSIGNDSTSLVNKGYVDNAVDKISTIATGALQFKGALSSTQSALDVLKDEYNNYYYKVTKDFPLSADNLDADSIHSGYNNNVFVGDTLIVKNKKFVYIPSGDDITAITITKDNQTQPILDRQTGSIGFTFNDVFKITNTSFDNNSNVVSITLPPVSKNNDGYLTAADYERFNQYSSALSVEYSQIAQSTDEGYDIGTITIGGTPTTIRGINSQYTLNLIEDSSSEQYPILQLQRTNDIKNDILIKGTDGISAVKDGNSIKLSSTIQVDSLSNKYLHISDDKKFIGVIVGEQKIVNEEATIIEGITPYSEFVDFKNVASFLHKSSVYFIQLEKSLNSDDVEADGKSYKYGGQALIDAISITI